MGCAPFLFFCLFFAYFSHVKDSDNKKKIILHKDNASKYKMQFLNDYFIY